MNRHIGLYPRVEIPGSPTRVLPKDSLLDALETAYRKAGLCETVRVHLFSFSTDFDGSHWTRVIRKMLTGKPFTHLEVNMDSHRQVVIALTTSKLVIETLLRAKNSPFTHKQSCGHMTGMDCEGCGPVPLPSETKTKTQRKNKNRRYNRRERRLYGKKKR